MISEEEAYRQILDGVEPLPARSVPLVHALGCFAAQEYFAGSPLPSFDNSAMDGYAVVAGSCVPGKRLRVIGEQPAGVDRKLRVAKGETVRIFTGAPIPNGADAVVMQEDVALDGSEIVVNTEVTPGEFVRRRGSDLSEGQRILAGGERLRAGSLAVLASQGLAAVDVGGQVTAGIISTGDELAKPGTKLEGGEIYDSNSVLLQTLLQTCGIGFQSSEHCRDDREVIIQALERGLRNSVLIITGGVSVGKHDLVKPALESLGAKLEIWRVSIKPGKPFLFGRAGQCAVFGLPGNPVSAFVTFLKFVRPAILKMMGANTSELELRIVPARLTEDITGDSDRPHYLRGIIGKGQFASVGRQESHALFGLSRANALLRVAPNGKFRKGEMVDVEIWD